MNGTVNISIVPTWGYKNQTSGEWTGMIGQVIRNEVDFGATALFFIAERVSVIEYISRSSTATSGFIFLSPKLSYTSNLYVLPFERLLWISSLVLVLILTLCLLLPVIFELRAIAPSEVRVNSIFLRLDMKIFLLQNQCSVSDVPIIIFGAMCQQSSGLIPNSIAGRMIMILSFITLMFLFVSYSANIVALLQSPSNQIKTLQDLYETKLDFSILDTVYNRHYFAVSV